MLAKVSAKCAGTTAPMGCTRDLKYGNGHFRVHYRVAAYHNGKRINAP